MRGKVCVKGVYGRIVILASFKFHFIRVHELVKETFKRYLKSLKYSIFIVFRGYENEKIKIKTSFVSHDREKTRLKNCY